MTHEKTKLLDKIVSYWPVIMATLILVVGWVNFGNADIRADERITAIEEQQKHDTEIQQQIQVKLAEIQTELVYIRKAVSK